MAEVQNVTLEIVPVSGGPGTWNVTVKCNVVFNPAEVGQEYKLAINLFGKDDMADDEQPFNPFTQTSLYTFPFGSPPAKYKYKKIKAQAEVQNVSESRPVTTTTLNEDPGQGHKDELYAVVSLTTEAKSPIVYIAV